MDQQELEALLGDLGSQRVERKSSASDMEKIQQAICALPITDELLLELSQLRDRGNILPLPSMTVQKLPYLGKDVAASWSNHP